MAFRSFNRCLRLGGLHHDVTYLQRYAAYEVYVEAVVLLLGGQGTSSHFFCSSALFGSGLRFTVRNCTAQQGAKSIAHGCSRLPDLNSQDLTTRMMSRETGYLPLSKVTGVRRVLVKISSTCGSSKRGIGEVNRRSHFQWTGTRLS